ncbi:MAG: hypothetical protein V3T25_01340 [Gemmatimonadota bacterium]
MRFRVSAGATRGEAGETAADDATAVAAVAPDAAATPGVAKA